MVSKIFQRFMDKSPVPVMVQVLLERVLCPDKLNSIFARTAIEQYTRTLLFSSIFELMNLVIFKTFPSVNAAYQEEGKQTGVSITSVYNKLSGIRVDTSAALVRETASEMTKIIDTLDGARASLLPGYRVKMLDGNCIEATEHRLDVLKDTRAGALPGKSLVVYDPMLEMAIDVTSSLVKMGMRRNVHSFLRCCPRLEKGMYGSWIETFVFVVFFLEFMTKMAILFVENIKDLSGSCVVQKKNWARQIPERCMNNG